MRKRTAIGDVFERLTVIGRAANSASGQPRWRCRCRCKNVKVVAGSALTSGHTQSCGCLGAERRREAARTHGMSGTPEHRAWKGMWARCLAKPGNKYFHLYTKQGIKVCARWKKFENFFKDAGPRPSAQHSLDRWPDPHGDYKPNNVRWATMKEQSNNRRDNRIVELNGKKFTLSALAEVTGFKVGTLRSRLYKMGWDARRAVAAPLNVTSIRAFTDAELKRQRTAIETEIRRRRGRASR